MHVCRVAGEQVSSFAVGRGLASHVGESRDPRGTVDSEVLAVGRGERFTDIAQRWFVGGSYLSLGQHDAGPPSILHLCDRVRASRIVAEAPLRLFGPIDL